MVERDGYLLFECSVAVLYVDCANMLSLSDARGNGMFELKSRTEGQAMKDLITARLERWLIVLIALHSFGIGIALLWAPSWGFEIGGWSEVKPLFFARQSGAFHIVVATGYLIEYFRYRGVLLLLAAKAIATVFLLGATITGEPWVVPFSGLADAAMGLVIFLVHRKIVRDGEPS